MKKQMIIIGIVAVICLGMIGGFASGIFKMGDIDELYTEEIIVDRSNSAEVKRAELQADKVARAESVAELAKNIGDWDSMDKFNQLTQALNACVDNPIEYNDILYNYEYLRRGYHLSDAQMDYIADLMINGYKPWDVLEICYFWLDTNEDISIIEEIYNQKWLFRGNTWIENAFNLVTDNKCGVLDEEDVEEYLKQGISFDDIMTANKLCRKGVLTIDEILELRKKQKTFAEITSVINEPETKTSLIETLKGYLSSMYAQTTETEEKAEISTAEVLAAETLSKMSNESIDVYYQKAANGEKLEELLEEKNASLEKEIDSVLKALYKPMTEEDMEEYMARGGAENEE